MSELILRAKNKNKVGNNQEKTLTYRRNLQSSLRTQGTNLLIQRNILQSKIFFSIAKSVDITTLKIVNPLRKIECYNL